MSDRTYSEAGSGGGSTGPGPTTFKARRRQEIGRQFRPVRIAPLVDWNAFRRRRRRQSAVLLTNGHREAERTDWDDLDWPVGDDLPDHPPEGFSEVFSAL